MLNSKRYKKILKTQQILKSAAQIKLKSDQILKVQLTEKKEELLEFLNNPQKLKIINENWLLQSISRTYTQEKQLDIILDKKKRDFLIAEKRVEISRDKYKQARKDEEEQQAVLALEEGLYATLSKETK